MAVVGLAPIVEYAKTKRVSGSRGAGNRIDGIELRWPAPSADFIDTILRFEIRATDDDPLSLNGNAWRVLELTDTSLTSYFFNSRTRHATNPYVYRGGPTTFEFRFVYKDTNDATMAGDTSPWQTRGANGQLLRTRADQPGFVTEATHSLGDGDVILRVVDISDEGWSDLKWNWAISNPVFQSLGQTSFPQIHITGLNNSQNYLFRCQQVSGFSGGPNTGFFAQPSGTPIAGIPGLRTPSSLSVTNFDVRGDHQVITTLRFTPDYTNDDGTARQDEAGFIQPDGYRVRYKLASSSTWIEIPTLIPISDDVDDPVDYNLDIRGIVGQAYDIGVAEVSGHSLSPYFEIETILPAPIPIDMLDLSETHNSSEAVLSWHKSGNANVTGYIIEKDNIKIIPDPVNHSDITVPQVSTSTSPPDYPDTDSSNIPYYRFNEVGFGEGDSTFTNVLMNYTFDVNYLSTPKRWSDVGSIAGSNVITQGANTATFNNFVWGFQTSDTGFDTHPQIHWDNGGNASAILNNISSTHSIYFFLGEFFVEIPLSTYTAFSSTQWNNSGNTNIGNPSGNIPGTVQLIIANSGAQLGLYRYRFQDLTEDDTYSFELSIYGEGVQTGTNIPTTWISETASISVTASGPDVPTFTPWMSRGSPPDYEYDSSGEYIPFPVLLYGCQVASGSPSHYQARWRVEGNTAWVVGSQVASNTLGLTTSTADALEIPASNFQFTNAEFTALGREYKNVEFQLRAIYTAGDSTITRSAWSDTETRRIGLTPELTTEAVTIIPTINSVTITINPQDDYAHYFYRLGVGVASFGSGGGVFSGASQSGRRGTAHTDSGVVDEHGINGFSDIDLSHTFTNLFANSTYHAIVRIANTYYNQGTSGTLGRHNVREDINKPPTGGISLARGWGDLGEFTTLAAATPAETAATPTGVSALRSSTGNITVGWGYALSTVAINFQVHYRLQGTVTWIEVTTASTRVPYNNSMTDFSYTFAESSISAISAGSTYQFAIRATASIGNTISDYGISDGFIRIPEAFSAGFTAPKLENIKLYLNANNVIIFEWDHVKSYRESTKYCYQYKLSSSIAWGAQTTIDSSQNFVEITTNGFSEGATYDFRVRADNPDGEGAWSDTISIVMPPTLPTPVFYAGTSMVRNNIGHIWIYPLNVYSKNGFPYHQLEYEVTLSGSGTGLPSGEMAYAQDHTYREVKTMDSGYMLYDDISFDGITPAATEYQIRARYIALTKDGNSYTKRYSHWSNNMSVSLTTASADNIQPSPILNVLARWTGARTNKVVIFEWDLPWISRGITEDSVAAQGFVASVTSNYERISGTLTTLSTIVTRPPQTWTPRARFTTTNLSWSHGTPITLDYDNDHISAPRHVGTSPAVGGTRVHFAWPEQIGSEASISSYEIEYAKSTEDFDGTSVTETAVASQTTYHVLLAVAAKQQWKIRVRAIGASTASGEWSDIVYGYALPSTPQFNELSLGSRPLQSDVDKSEVKIIWDKYKIGSGVGWARHQWFKTNAAETAKTGSPIYETYDDISNQFLDNWGPSAGVFPFGDAYISAIFDMTFTATIGPSGHRIIFTDAITAGDAIMRTEEGDNPLTSLHWSDLANSNSNTAIHPDLQWGALSAGTTFNSRGLYSIIFLWGDNEFIFPLSTYTSSANRWRNMGNTIHRPASFTTGTSVRMLIALPQELDIGKFAFESTLLGATSADNSSTISTIYQPLPDDIENLRRTHKERVTTEMDVAWDALEGASGYQVRWKLESGSSWSSWVSINSPSTLSYRITGLVPPRAYDIQVRPLFGTDIAGAAVEFEETAPSIEFPTGLSISALNGRIDVDIDSLTTGASYHRIRWRANSTDVWQDWWPDVGVETLWASDHNITVVNNTNRGSRSLAFSTGERAIVQARGYDSNDVPGLISEATSNVVL